MFGSAVKVLDTAEYTAWPYNNLHYDTTREKLWLVYTSGEAHLGAGKSVYYVEINTTTDTFGTPAVIAAAKTDPVVAGGTCHTAGICPNGDYAIVASLTRKTPSPDTSRFVRRTAARTG